VSKIKRKIPVRKNYINTGNEVRETVVQKEGKTWDMDKTKWSWEDER
jgi:hypothetical protein